MAYKPSSSRPSSSPSSLWSPVREAMEYKCKNVEEARSLIHRAPYVGHGNGHLLIPVPGTTRWVGVRDSGNGWMYIDTSRPGDVLPSQAVSVWGDQPLEELVFKTDWSEGDYGPPHTATREEWGNLLHHLPRLMPTLTGRGVLCIDKENTTSNSYNEVLGSLPPALPHLVAERGVRWLTLWQGVVSARSVLSFMSTLHQEGWPVKACWLGCKVGTPGGEVRVALYKTSVVGSKMTLKEVHRLNPSPLYRPEWPEEEEDSSKKGSQLGGSMYPSQRFESSFPVSEAAFPEITYHESLNQAVVVEIGGDVQLEAAIRGGPETILKWYHLDREIHSNEDITITLTEEKTVLSITNSTEAHDGEYTLKAHNPQGFFHSFFKISVFAVRPRDIHIKPPPPDIFGAKLSSKHSLTLKHPSSEITLTIPKGAVPEGVEDEVEGQILVDLNNYLHLFPEEEYLIAPIVDYNIKNKQFKEFKTAVEIRIPHHIIDPNVRKNIKVYSIDGEKKPEPIGKDTASEVYYEIQEKCILISLKHFTQFPCTTHGQECEMEAILRLYMVTSGKPGDHTAKLSPKLLLGCGTSPEFKGNVYLDPGMVIKSQKQFELRNPYQCLSVSSEIEQSKPWKVLKGGSYVETIEAQVTPVEHILKNKMKIPKVIALSEYMLSESRGEKLSCTLHYCFRFQDGDGLEEKIQLGEDFSTQEVKGLQLPAGKMVQGASGGLLHTTSSQAPVTGTSTGQGVSSADVVSGPLTADLSKLSDAIDPVAALKTKVPAAQNFVLHEQPLEEGLDQVEPAILKHMDVNQILISELKSQHVLNKHVEQQLKSSQLNADKVSTLMDHIRRDTRGKFLPLLQALQATGQERVVQEFDKEEIRNCLNLENREKSLFDNLCQPHRVRQLHQSPVTERDESSGWKGWRSKCLLL